MNNQIVVHNQSVSDIETMAKAITKSGLFGIKSPEQAVALMLVAQSEGRHPASVASEFDIIQGRPALKSQAALARFQNAGGKIQWTSRSDTKCSAKFSHPQGGELEITWTIERAAQAGLTNKQTWRQFPTQLLGARCVAEGVRAVFPACLNGVYLAEEVQDFDATPALVKAAKVVKEEPKVEKVEIVSSVSLDELPDAEWGSEDHSWADDFESKIFEIANDVTLFLRHKGLITTEQTWRDLPEGAYRERLTRNPDKFIEAVKAFTK